MLRGLSHNAFTQECVDNTGVRDSPAACIIVAFEVCATSTNMPSRFNSTTASRPNADNPPCSASGSFRSRRGLELSASALCPKCVTVK